MNEDTAFNADVGAADASAREPLPRQREHDGGYGTAARYPGTPGSTGDGIGLLRLRTDRHAVLERHSGHSNRWHDQDDSAYGRTSEHDSVDWKQRRIGYHGTGLQRSSSGHNQYRFELVPIRFNGDSYKLYDHHERDVHDNDSMDGALI